MRNGKWKRGEKVSQFWIQYSAVVKRDSTFFSFYKVSCGRYLGDVGEQSVREVADLLRGHEGADGAVGVAQQRQRLLGDRQLLVLDGRGGLTYDVRSSLRRMRSFNFTGYLKWDVLLQFWPRTLGVKIGMFTKFPIVYMSGQFWFIGQRVANLQTCFLLFTKRISDINFMLSFVWKISW